MRVARTWFDEVLVALEPGISRHEGTHEHLRYVIRYAVEVVRREPTLTRYILNELRPDPAFRATEIHGLNRRFTGIVRRSCGTRSCVATSATTSVELLRDMIFGGIEHQAWAYLRGEGDFSIDRSPRASRRSSTAAWQLIEPPSRADEGVSPMPTVSYWPADPGEVRDVTVCETIRHAAATVPDRVALVDCLADPATRREWTYAELLADAERAARALLARFALGDRIAVWAPNSAVWIILQQGVAMAGMVIVALNPAYRTRELEFVLRESGAVGLFCVDSYRDFAMRELVDDIRPGLPELREVFSFSGWDDVLAGGNRHGAADRVARRSPAGPVHLRHHRLPQGRDAAPQGPGQRGDVRGRAVRIRRRRGLHRRHPDVPHRRWRGDVVR